jgi:hypothetical protein
MDSWFAGKPAPTGTLAGNESCNHLSSNVLLLWNWQLMTLLATPPISKEYLRHERP